MRQLSHLITFGAVLSLCSGLGCGGGSSGGVGAGSLNVQPVWQQPNGESTASLPSAVITVRILFESDAGLRCCLAVNPRTVPVDSATALRLLVLDALPPGTATLTLSGFATDFAPAPEGITAICPTNPIDVGQPCDTVRLATPSFQSLPQTVTIIPGTRAQAPTVDVQALPFLIDLQPAQADSAQSPVPISFAAVDAATGIDRNSIAVEASFRSLTKRVPITLSACDDKSDNPCSAQGQFQVSGFRAVGVPAHLPSGTVSLRITAQNLSSPPDQLDFTYDFTVLPGGVAAGANSQSDTANAASQPLPSPFPGKEAVRSPLISGEGQGEVAGGLACSATPTPAVLMYATPTPTVTPTVAQPLESEP